MADARMIPGDIKPIGNVSPYKRIDLNRKDVITQAEVDANNGREPDPTFYVHQPMLGRWYLKDFLRRTRS
jgi:hypothetical protein